MGHLNVMILLRTGVSVDLPEGRQTLACEVQLESSYIGRQVQQCSEEAGEANVEIIVILCGHDVLLPNPQSEFKAEDRLLVMALPKGWEWLDNHFVRLRPEGE